MGKEKQIKITKGSVCYMCVYTELDVHVVLRMLGYNLFDAMRNNIVVLVDGSVYKYNKINKEDK